MLEVAPAKVPQNEMYAGMRVLTKDGRTFEAIEYSGHLGGPSKPFGSERIREKFLECKRAYGDRALGEQLAAPVLSMRAAATPTQKGITSVEIAVRLLRVVEENPEPMTLKEIADAIGFSTSKTHHYLVSLTRTKLLDRERGGMRYTLGSFALRLGLTTLGRSGSANLIGDALRNLRDQIGHSTCYAVWSERGPLVTHVEESRAEIGVSLRLGSVLPLVNSATSAIFIAWLPDADLAPVVNSLPPGTLPLKRIVQIREQTRREGGSHSFGARSPQIAAASAPVFGPDGRLAGAIGTFGLKGQFDDRPTSSVSKALRRSAAMLSNVLGGKV